MYAPNFSELAAVTVRRLAWAMGANMGQAVDVLVKALPAFINTQKVCELCKDKTKCAVCACKSVGEMPDKALGLLYSEVLP
jgi:recombinational DNA repair protein RecR